MYSGNTLKVQIYSTIHKYQTLGFHIVFIWFCLHEMKWYNSPILWKKEEKGYEAFEHSLLFRCIEPFNAGVCHEFSQSCLILEVEVFFLLVFVVTGAMSNCANSFASSRWLCSGWLCKGMLRGRKKIFLKKGSRKIKGTQEDYGAN